MVSSPYKFEINSTSGLSAHAQKLLNKSEARKQQDINAVLQWTHPQNLNSSQSTVCLQKHRNSSTNHRPRISRAWQKIYQVGEDYNELTHRISSIRSAVCQQMGWNCSINQSSGNCGNSSRHDQKLSGPGACHNKCIHQFWQLLAQRYVWKCTETIKLWWTNEQTDGEAHSDVYPQFYWRGTKIPTNNLK